MKEPIRKPLPLPLEWTDQEIDYRRPPRDFMTSHVQPLDQHAVIIHYKRPRLTASIIVSLVAVAIMGLLLYAMGPRFVTDPSYRTFWNFLAFVLFAAFLVWVLMMFVLTVVGIVNRVREKAFIAVAPTGVYHKSAGWTAFFPWDEIFRFRAFPSARWEPSQRIYISPWDDDKMFVQDRRRIKWPKIDQQAPGNREIFAGELAVVDVALPYWALRFYHENPEYRRELGAEAGLRRFQQADFPCEEEPDAERRSE